MTTRNETISLNEWTELTVKKMSNTSKYNVQIWVGTVAPTEGSLGHIIKPNEGISSEDFDAGDRFWFKGSNSADIITITE